MLPDARGYRIDNGAENYRRFLRGDEEGIAEIVRAYKDGLIFYLNGYVNDISLVRVRGLEPPRSCPH